MTETVIALDIGVTWEPNAPGAVLVANDAGDTALALRPHWDDADRSAVVLVWNDSRYSAMSDPNDEAVGGHRLYGRGLEAVMWIGQVSDSDMIAMLEKQNSVHPRHDPTRFADMVHHVVLTKDQVIEVVARGFAVMRISRSPREAVMTALQTRKAE